MPAPHRPQGALYAAAAVGDPPGGVYTAVLLLSHVPMLYAVVYAFTMEIARLAVPGLASLVVSCLYHLCRATNGALCAVAPVHVWRLADHVCVNWLLGAVGLQLLFTTLAPRRSQFFYLVASYLNFPVGLVGVLLFPFSAYEALFPVALVLVVGLVRLIEFGQTGCAAADGRDRLSPRLETAFLVYLLAGFCAAALGFVFFFLDDGAPAGDSAMDAVAHTLWHFFSGVALYCVTVATDLKAKATLRLHAAAAGHACHL